MVKFPDVLKAQDDRPHQYHVSTRNMILMFIKCSVPGKRTAKDKGSSLPTSRPTGNTSRCDSARLPDLSAAFDTVDHNILIERFHTAFGISGPVLSWIKSFVRMRTQTVIFNGTKSTQSVLDCGVSQDRVLGSVLFLLYTANVTTSLINRASVHTHTRTIRSSIVILKLCRDLRR